MKPQPEENRHSVMNAERWQRVKTIFHRAVECDPDAREELLRESCGVDQELRDEVESLLASDGEERTLLNHHIKGASQIAIAAPARSSDPMIGRTIGNYLITGELARGGMGVVYRARHVTLPRDAVVKCIRPFSASEEVRNDLRARFKREAHIQCQLDHPHIVRVYEFFAGTDEYFLVMEYVRGVSLQLVLDQTPVLSPEEVTALGVQALEGLAHAHGLHFVDEAGHDGVGIIHRDIKPANLLLDEHRNLKLTDFGIAKVVSENELTRPGYSLGTVEYMSPEQIRGLQVDARSDLYSLGVTLYEALTGRTPFSRSDFTSDFEILKAHTETEAQPIHILNPAVPESLAAIVNRSMKKDPNARWQTAEEFRAALLEQQSTQPGTTILPSGLAVPRISRKQAIAAGIAVLAVMILAGVLWWTGGRRAASTGGDQPSIAVLPFVDDSPEKNQEYFSVGLTDELVNALAKIQGLQVAGRTSSFQFKGQTGDYSVIGKKLHVASILEGSVRRQGNRAKVNVDLIQASDGFHVWAEAYNREMNDIFAVQDEIARAVSSALKVKLLGKTHSAGAAKSTNAEAYTAYLHGRFFLGRPTKENLDNAAGYFMTAIKLDPSYAPGWVGLGSSYSIQASFGFIPVGEGYRKAREDIQHALTLDPDLAEAHSAMARIMMFHDWDWVNAEAYIKRAMELEPGNPSVIRRSGALSGYRFGRWEDAIAPIRRSVDSDPLNAGAYYDLGRALYYAGRNDEAMAAFKKGLGIAPDRIFLHCMIGHVLLAQSQPEKALAEALKENDPAYRLYGLALAYHALKRSKESDASLAELIAKFKPDVLFQIAEVYAFRGEPNKAFEWLDLAYAERDSGLTEIKGDPLLKSLIHDPRYAALLKRMGLPL